MKHRTPSAHKSPLRIAEPGAFLGPEPPVRLPHTHAMLAQVLSTVFADLDLGVSLMDGATWYPVHRAASTLGFEDAHGVEDRRWAYNVRCLEKARRTGGLVLGEHSGFYDMFLSLQGTGGAWGALVTGPFAIARPTGSEILLRWRALTGGHGHRADPEFLHYVSATLTTATFDRSGRESLERLLGCFSDLLLGRGRTAELAKEVDALRAELADVRFAERMWEAAQSMVDERTSRAWTSTARARDLWLMGLERPAEHVLVGLLVGREADTDPVDDLVRRDAFQRACVAAARKRRRTICGRIDDYGVTLLLADTRAGASLRARLADDGDWVRTIARRFGLRVHFGMSDPDAAAGLPGRYQSSLAAAERALAQGVSSLPAEREPRRGAIRTHELRRELTEAVIESPDELSPRFGRYLETVAARCGYRLEAARAHLEAGFGDLTAAIRATRELDEKGLTDLLRSLEQHAARANTLAELRAAYRAAISDMESSLFGPKDARRDRGIRRAITFVREHLSEPLGVAKVARIAGFATDHFARLFQKSEHTTLHRYVRRLRLERAKHLLLSTKLNVERIAELSGFPNRSHFHRAFKQAERVAPLEYRSRSWRPRAASRKS